MSGKLTVAKLVILCDLYELPNLAIGTQLHCIYYVSSFILSII